MIPRKSEWTAIPNFLIEMDLDPKAFKLYCAYLRNEDYHYQQVNQPYASDEHMMKLCGMTVRSLQRAKKILKELNLIHVRYSDDNISIVFCETAPPTQVIPEMAESDSRDMAENIILKDIKEKKLEIVQEKNFKEIEEKALRRNKEITEIKRTIKQKENELEISPNYTITKELKREIRTLKNRLAKLDPKEVQAPQIKEYVEIPPIIYYFRIPRYFKSLLGLIDDSFEKKFTNAIYPLRELTQKQVDLMLKIIYKYFGVEEINEVIESFTEEDIIKLKNGEVK